MDYSTGEILTKFPDKGFSNNPAKTVWKPDMTNISPELRKMFREEKTSRKMVKQNEEPF